MKDNISIVVAAIIGTILVVLIPLISILDRQDNMSYNVVLTATTNFVDEVKSKGFIDKVSYEKYLDTIAATGNVYDLQLEAYKKFTYKNTADENVEDELLYNTKDITDELNSPTGGIYDLEVGDEFYISIENTNTPSSVLMYNYISGDIGSKEKKIININYGGTVNNKDWEAYSETIKNYEHYPTIIIGVPENGNTYDVAEKSYFFDLSTVTSIKLQVTLKNFTKFWDGTGDPIIPGENTFKQYIDILGLDNVSYNIENIHSIGGNTYTFEIVLTNIVIPTMTADINVVILPGLGSYGDELISTGKQSATLHLTGNLTAYGLEIKGPYYHNGREIKNKILYVNPGNSIYPYFNIVCRNIDSSYDIATIEDAIKNPTPTIPAKGLKFSNVIGSVETVSGSDPNFGGYRESTVKTEVKYTSAGGNAFVELLDNWLGSYKGATLKDPPYPPYTVDMDTTAPGGQIHAMTDTSSIIPCQTTVGPITYDVISKQNIKIYVGNISDIESGVTRSGVYQIHLRNGTSGSWETREITDDTDFVDWSLTNTDPMQEINYTLEDNAGNISAVYTLNIMYNERSKYR